MDLKRTSAPHTIADRKRRLSASKLKALQDQSILNKTVPLKASLYETDLFKLTLNKISTQELQQSFAFYLSRQQNIAQHCPQTLILQLFHRVWSGYTKYLRSQIEKGKIVSCQYFGSFIPLSILQLNPEDMNGEYEDSIAVVIKGGQKGSNNKVAYKPHAASLESMKLLYQDEGVVNLNPYSNFNGQNQVAVSYSSIGQVTGSSENEVRLILDYVQKGIEYAVKNNMNVKLNMRIGFIKIREGCLSFQQINLKEGKDQDLMSVTSSQSTMAQLQKRKFIYGDIKSVTQASWRSFSNTKQSHYNPSVMTPYTHSKRQLSTSDSPQSTISAQKFIHSSNPNPQNGVNRYQRLTNEKIQEINKSNGFSIPGFVGLYQNGEHYKFGKRISGFGNLDRRGVLSYQLNQLQEKMTQFKLDQDGQRENEIELLRQIREQLMYENQRKLQKKLKMRNEFVKANSVHREEKKIREYIQRDADRQYRINFFPFTHGEDIERKRAEQKLGLNQELRSHLADDTMKFTQTRLNKSWVNVAQSGTSLYSDDAGKMSPDYLTQYPHFLRPVKHYPTRRMDDTHIKNAMEVALERYEKELVSQENERMKHLEQIEIAHNKDIKNQQDIQKQREKLVNENKKYLEQQIVERKKKAQADQLKEKLPAKPHFGPEENFLSGMVHQKDMTAVKHNLATTLREQAEQKKSQAARQKEIERLMELQNLAQASLVMMSERDTLLEKEKFQKEVYKNAWEQQMKVREAQKKINKGTLD